MGKYSDYNIIPIGDHCSIAMTLKELNLRKASYPFDWIAKIDPVHETNIIENMSLINELNLSDNMDDIVKKLLGNAIENGRINSATNITFPHDNETDMFEKYKRRFVRLKSDLNKKNFFIILTRHYYIQKDVFQLIMEQLLNYNSDSIILFISGTNHTYFENMNCPNVIFKYIEYDISKFFEYDYTTFRPNLKMFLSDLLL